MKHQLKHQYQSGIGLLEILLALAIIAILLTTATRYYQTARDTQRVNEALNIMQNLHHAGAQYYMDRGDMSENLMSEFKDRGLVPKQFSAQTANPWGGEIKANGQKNTINFILTQVPKKSCENLRVKINQKMEDLIEKNVAPCVITGGSGDPRGDLSVTFDYGV